MPPSFRQIFFRSESQIFIASQVIAGLLNYLFQIHAARELGPIAFGQWSGWLADFSTLLFLGAWLQSVSSLSDVSRAVPRKIWTVGFFVLTVLFFWSQSSGAILLAGACGWAGSLLCGALIGSALREGRLRAIAVATVTGVALRFAWVPIFPDLFGFQVAVLIPPLVTAGILLIWPGTADHTLKATGGKSRVAWFSALCLAFFSAWAPQADLVVAKRVLSEVELGQWAHIALIYKAFFFGFVIVAQLLLSNQVRRKEIRFRNVHLLLLASIGLVTASIAAFAAPQVQLPGDWTFWSVLHITTLTISYLMVQDFAVRHRVTPAFALVLVTFVIAGLEVAIREKMTVYLQVSVIIEAMAVGFLAARTRE